MTILAWRKASYSAEANCVEMATLVKGGIAIRDSKNPDAGMMVFTRDEIDAFFKGVKAGEFDDMA